MDEKHPNSSKFFRIQGHHVFVLYVTIPNVTIPKLIIFPNIYTNPDPKLRMPIETLTQQQSWVRGKRAFLPPPAKLGVGRKAVVTYGIVTYRTNTWCPKHC